MRGAYGAERPPTVHVTRGAAARGGRNNGIHDDGACALIAGIGALAWLQALDIA